MSVHPENPLLFDFIVDRGQDKINNDLLKVESTKLIKYFLASMTIPDQDAWVNLSPYEKDRIIPDALGQTEMGRQMLEQDYMLKQLASSLTNPDTPLGKQYWDEVRRLETLTSSSQSLTPNQLNKVWIIPDSATVVEKDGFAYITDSKLNVMLDEEYLVITSPAGARQSSDLSSPKAFIGDPQSPNRLPLKARGNDSKDKIAASPAAPRNDTANVQYPTTNDQRLTPSIPSQVFRKLILPKLIEEVNTGKSFAPTRQVYQSVILAAWYKKALKDSLLGRIYADKSKIAGVETDVKDIKQKVYEQYLEAFKKGAYNVIKEELDSEGDLIPRKYFSGGLKLGMNLNPNQLIVDRSSSAVNRVTNEIKHSPEDQLAFVAASGVETPGEAVAITASSGLDYGQLPSDLRATTWTMDLRDFARFSRAEKGYGYYGFGSGLLEGFLWLVEDSFPSGQSAGAVNTQASILRILNFESDIQGLVPEIVEQGNIKRPLRVRMDLEDFGFDVINFLKNDYATTKQHIVSLGKWMVGIPQRVKSFWGEFTLDTMSRFYHSEYWYQQLVQASEPMPLLGGLANTISIKDSLKKLKDGDVFPYAKMKVLSNAQVMSNSRLWDSLDVDEQFDVLIELAETFSKIHQAGVVVKGIQPQFVVVSRKNGQVEAMPIDFSQSYLYGNETTFNPWLVDAPFKQDIIDFASLVNRMFINAHQLTDWQNNLPAKDQMEVFVDDIITARRIPKDMHEFARQMREIKQTSLRIREEYKTLEEQVSKGPDAASSSGVASSAIAKRIVVALVAAGILSTVNIDTYAQQIAPDVSRQDVIELSAQRGPLLAALKILNYPSASEEFKQEIKDNIHVLLKKQGHGLVPIYKEFDSTKPTVLFIHGATKEGGAITFVDAFKEYYQDANLIAFQFDDSRTLEEIAQDLKTRWQDFQRRHNVDNVIVVAHSYGNIVLRQAVVDDQTLFAQAAVIEVAPTHGGSARAMDYGGVFSKAVTTLLGFENISKAQDPKGLIQASLYTEGQALPFSSRMTFLVEGDENNPPAKLESELSPDEKTFNNNFKSGLKNSDVRYLKGRDITHGNSPFAAEVLDAIGTLIKASASSGVESRRNFLKSIGALGLFPFLLHGNADAADFSLTEGADVIVISQGQDTFESIAQQLISKEILDQLNPVMKKEILEIAFNKFKQENPQIKFEGIDQPFIPETKFLSRDTHNYLAFVVYMALSDVVAQHTVELMGKNIPIYYLKPRSNIPYGTVALAFGKYGIIVDVDQVKGDVPVVEEFFLNSQGNGINRDQHLSKFDEVKSDREILELFFSNILTHELGHIAMWDYSDLPIQSPEPWVKNLIVKPTGPMARQEVWAYLIEIANSKIPRQRIKTLMNFAKYDSNGDKVIPASRIVAWSILDKLKFGDYLGEEDIKYEQSLGRGLSFFQKVFYSSRAKEDWDRRKDDLSLISFMERADEFLATQTTEQINRAAGDVFYELSGGKGIPQIPADLKPPEKVFEVLLASASSNAVVEGSTVDNISVSSPAASNFTKGGIDFDPSKLNLQIKRDGRGVPLPLLQQDIENIHINGLYPVILNILPVNAQTLPILGQLNVQPEAVLSKG
ncbi:MAG: alpha/beta hydrolase [Candidatus Omnitrophica bacterium]|nr:alpha/beta hydrolase [Candidatus Omnitrophota bacterium]